MDMRLQDAQEYRDWMEHETIVAEGSGTHGTLITITESGDGYNIYRTFTLGDCVCVSVDAERCPVEKVFEYLLRY